MDLLVKMLRVVGWGARRMALLLVLAALAAAGGGTPDRDCELAALAFEFGSARVANTAALHDGLRLGACDGAPARPPSSPPLRPPPAVAAELMLHVATTGNDTHPGSQGAPFATLARAAQAIRAAACRQATPPCAAVVTVAPGRYDLNETLRLDERDSRVTWLAAGPGVKLGGSVRLPRAMVAS